MNKYCQFLEQKLKYIIIAQCKQVQMVKTLYVGIYNISSFFKISKIQIISQKVRFGHPQNWRFGAPLVNMKNEWNGTTKPMRLTPIPESIEACEDANQC